MKILILTILFTVFSCSQLPKRRTDKLSILQGVTTSKEVEFSVVAPKEKNLRFELRSADGDILNPEEIKTISRPSSEYVIYKILFIKKAEHDHNLYAFEGDQVIDQRLVGRGQQNPDKLKIAVASCMNDYYSEHFKIWDVLSQKNPEYLLLIGDNVYADKKSKSSQTAVTPEKLWKRYLDVRLSLPLFYQQKLIPTHALWDDHDYGIDNGGADYEYKAESKEIFDAFYAQDLSEEFIHGKGVGGLLSLGDFNFYFLDGRTFRSSLTTGTQLGIDQYQWLLTNIKEEKTPSFIIKGDQFFGGYHTKDSYEGKHPREFTDFVLDLKNTEAPFIFLSGDRHMSEIMQFPRSLFGRPSFEITSSPMHSQLKYETDLVNPWRVVAELNHMNFTLINNMAENDHWFLEVESIGENNEVFYRRELAVYIKDLQNNLNEVRKKRQGKRRYRRIKRRR
ncbi:MAG: alkaline phosphatase D family protein [Bacteriovoracaceae bacterium]